MSTRATYTVTDANGVTAHIYIHHDGYEDGAAMYFYNALTLADNGDKSFAEAMLRANLGAELTTHADHHGDTEYHYEIKRQGNELHLSAFELKRDWQAKTCKKKNIYSGPIQEFVNQHTALIEGFTPFKRVEGSYGHSQWLNLAAAKNKLADKYSCLGHLRVWKNGANRDSANWKHCADELGKIVAAFPELATDEVLDLLNGTTANAVMP